MTEKVFHLRTDIDNIYNKSFKPIVDEIEKALRTGEAPARNGKLMKFLDRMNYDTDTHVLLEIDSSKLVSADAKKAHEIRPVKISLQIGKEGNFYRPSDEQILVSIPENIIDIFQRMLWDKKEILRHVKDPTIFKEITENKLKGTINHEMSHWIRNSLTGHLDKMFTKMSKKLTDKQRKAIKNQQDVGEFDRDVEKIKIKSLTMGNISTVATSYELDAYVHNIMEYKISVGLNKYNQIKLSDLFIELPALKVIKGAFKKYKLKNINDTLWSEKRPDYKQKWEAWQKHLIKRLDREKLLGKNMRKLDKTL